MYKLEIDRLWKGFWQLADPKIWVASTIPMVVGGALSYSDTGRFDIFWFLISLAAVYLIEIGKNAVNEVIDYHSGVDRSIAEDRKTPFSGGKKTIVQGKLMVFEAGAIGFLTIGAACLIGLYIMIFRDFTIFWIGFVGVLLSVFYSLPPFKFAYRGLGEAVVGLTFGPLIVSGIYLVMTGALSPWAVLVSLPIGLVIANVLWINQYPDYEADAAGGKRNWVVRLGKKRSLMVYRLLFAAAFVLLVPIAVIYRNPLWLLGCLGAFPAFKAVKAAKQYYDDIPRLMAANAGTVISYQLMGLGMTIAAMSNRWI